MGYGHYTFSFDGQCGNKQCLSLPDVGGKDKIRKLWRYWYQNTTALVFVVDSNDRERMHSTFDAHGTACDELHQMLKEDELRDVPVLVFANKQDLPNALSDEEVQDRLMMTQWTEQSPEFLMSLRKETYLKLLPESIIRILSEYTPERECGPCLTLIEISDLNHQGMWTSTSNLCYDGITNTDAWRLRGYNVHRRICGLICEYLPPYGYGSNGTQTKCFVQGSCATTGEGLYEGLDWLSEAMNAEKITSLTSCAVM